MGESALKLALGRPGTILFEESITVAGGQVILFKAWSAGVSGLSGLYSFYQMGQRIGDDDYDAAAAYGFAGIAYIALSLSKIGAAQLAYAAANSIPVAEAGGLAFLGPWAWAILIVAIGATVAAIMLTDTEIEQWSKYGPFAKDHADRWTHDFTARDPRYTYAALLGLLIQLKVSIRYAGPESSTGPTDVIVEVTTPGLDKTRSKIVIQTSAQKRWGTVIKGVSHENPQEPHDYEPHFISYYRAEEINNDKNDAFSLRYYFKGLSNLHSRYIWRARARHVIEQKGVEISLPPTPDEKNLDDKTVIDSSRPGWVYADLNKQ